MRRSLIHQLCACCLPIGVGSYRWPSRMCWERAYDPESEAGRGRFGPLGFQVALVETASRAQVAARVPATWLWFSGQRGPRWLGGPGHVASVGPASRGPAGCGVQTRQVPPRRYPSAQPGQRRRAPRRPPRRGSKAAATRASSTARAGNEHASTPRRSARAPGERQSLDAGRQGVGARLGGDAVRLPRRTPRTGPAPGRCRGCAAPSASTLGRGRTVPPWAVSIGGLVLAALLGVVYAIRAPSSTPRTPRGVRRRHG
jgi:hypothetical protein